MRDCIYLLIHNLVKFNKKFGLIAFLLVIFIGAVGGGVWYMRNNSNTPPAALASHCGLIIDGPAINSVTTFPVTIHGAIDNNYASTLGCAWTMFEGQAGTAQVYYWDQGNNNWQAVNTPFVIPVSNWMTLGPVAFAVTVNFNNNGLGLSSGNLMKVTFTEENPSGQGTADTLDWPLVLQ